MNLAQSYYEILGVSRTATAQEIRAAYLRLMKRYHPDAARRDGGAADLASVLNLCYAVLRNPVTRSQYDTELLRLSRVPIVAPRQHYPAAQRSKRGWTMVLIAGAFAFVILMSLDPTSERKTRKLVAAAAGWISPRSPPTNAGLSVRMPDTAETRRMADLARKLPARDAEQFSRQCFAAQQRSSGHVDSCILFDVAFLYWRKTPVSRTSPAYFTEQVVYNRHREVMNPFGSAAEWRLRDLRRIAFLALMDNFKEAQSTRVKPKPTLDHGVWSAEVREGERQRLDEAAVP